MICWKILVNQVSQNYPDSCEYLQAVGLTGLRHELKQDIVSLTKKKCKRKDVLKRRKWNFYDSAKVKSHISSDKHEILLLDLNKCLRTSDFRARERTVRLQLRSQRPSLQLQYVKESYCSNNTASLGVRGHVMCLSQRQLCFHQKDVISERQACFGHNGNFNNLQREKFRHPLHAL